VIDPIFDERIDEAMLRRYIARVKSQFEDYEEAPQLLEITALAWACERLLDERAAAPLSDGEDT